MVLLDVREPGAVVWRRQATMSGRATIMACLRQTMAPSFCKSTSPFDSKER